MGAHHSGASVKIFLFMLTFQLIHVLGFWGYIASKTFCMSFSPSVLAKFAW